jgi:predicted TIM-barrel enzyme
MDRLLRDLKQRGFSGVQSFLTVALIDGHFRESREQVEA